VVAHDPSEKASLSYLAASKEGEPIYLNRLLCEADVVIPINLLRPRSCLGYTGVHSGLYPTFSDESTQKRFRAPRSAMRAGDRRRRKAEADEVAWLLGLQLTVQIVAGSGNSLLHVLAGLPEEVAEVGLELVKSAWLHDVPGKAQLVVAAIEGGSADQTWENFARALYVASRLCADQGTIVLCTDLKRHPGPSLQRLAGYEEDAKLLQLVNRDRSEDAVSALLLLESRERQHVFLLSGLDENAVEAIGLGHITSTEQIRRLSGGCQSCILLADAHRAAVKSAASA
jgi:nickel-dependent lactate racemase